MVHGPAPVPTTGGSVTPTGRNFGATRGAASPLVLWGGEEVTVDTAAAYSHTSMVIDVAAGAGSPRVAACLLPRLPSASAGSWGRRS